MGGGGGGGAIFEPKTLSMYLKKKKKKKSKKKKKKKKLDGAWIRTHDLQVLNTIKQQLQNISEKSTIFKQHLLKKNPMIFFYIFAREFSHCTLQADKSFEPLPIILPEITHLQNCRVQNSKKGNNSKSII